MGCHALLQGIFLTQELNRQPSVEEGCGRILIAHRITTIMHADRIIVMDKGKVAEQGSHEELLARGGIYRRIYDLQMNGIGEEEWNG